MIKLTDENRVIVERCLMILAEYGSHEAGAVESFNIIAGEFNIDADYGEYVERVFPEEDVDREPINNMNTDETLMTCSLNKQIKEIRL